MKPDETRGLWLGMLGVAIFALTLPMTRLAVGTAQAPQMSGVFIALGRAVVAAGLSALFLLATRAPDEVLLVVQAPPDLGSPRLLPAGAAGLGTGGTLTSSTTRRRGIFAGIDVLPTVLRHLGRPIPDTVRGQPIRTRPGRDAAALRRLEARLRVVLARRVPALRTLLLTWAGLLLALVAADRRRGLRRALRLGGLGIFWVPSVLLATAALAPGREVELALISAAAFALAILTDLLVGWPRGLAVPAVVGLAAYAADLAAGSPLIVRALLGPNPRSGSRYFGLGNELEAILPILLFVGLAAALPTLRRSRRGALTFALAGLALGVVAGSGRLGADVGAVITIGAGAATATVLMLPGGPTRRAVAIALLVPAAALVGLAALDLLTGGDSHFTRTVLHARSGGDLWDTISRRYELAYRNLVLGAMPVLTALSVGAVAWAVVRREDVLAPVRGSAAWRAGLAGALASCVAGTLFNDSGPLVLVFGVFMLLFATLYVRGVPPSPAPQVARGGAPASPAPVAAGSAARGID